MSVIKAEFSPLGRVGAQPLVIEAAELRGLFEQIEALEARARKAEHRLGMLLALAGQREAQRKLNDGRN